LDLQNCEARTTASLEACDVAGYSVIMTIRDYILKRSLAIRYLGIVWVITIAVAAIALPERYANVDAWQAACYLIPIYLLYGIVGFATKCPRCQTNLGVMTVRMANPFAHEFGDQCHKCSVRFGEPIEGPITQQTSRK